MSLVNHIIRWSTASTICTALLLAATSCHKEDSASKNGGQGGAKQQSKAEAKTLRLYLHSEPLSMHPQRAGNRLSLIVTRELFEGLMRMDKRGNPSFAVANAVELSDDKLIYRFHLRPTQWSNGLPVTAHDFEYAWKNAVHPASNTNYSYAFYCIKNARKARLGEVNVDEVGIHAENDHTLVVTLENPAPYFMELTSNPLYSPICKAVAERNSSWNNQAGPDYVTNGPFVLSEWKHQAELVLTKNHNYWDSPSVAIHKMTFPIVTDPQTALSMFEAGEIDWAGDPFGSIPLEAIPHLKEDKKLYAREIESVNWLELNINHPLLSSAKVRRALAMAVNRQELVDHLLQGGEKPAFTLLPRSLTLLDQAPFKDNDIEYARCLFEEGVQELQLPRNSLPMVNINHSSDPRDKMIAEAIQQQWQKVFSGIKIELSPADWNAHLKRLAAGDFHIAGVNWYTFYSDPLYNLEFLKYKTGNFNGTGWEHPMYISLLDQSDREADLTRRSMLLRQAEELVMNEMPLIPLCYNTSKFVKNPRVSGEILSPIIGTYEWKQVDIEGSNMVLVRK